MKSGPWIKEIVSDSVNIGVITISGKDFGDSQGSSFVLFNFNFNNVKALVSDYQSWSNTQIKVKVPVGVRSGKVSVTVNGIKSNEVNFTVNSLPNQITIYASKDTYVDNCRADDNYNGSNLQLGRYLGTLTGCINKPSDRNIALYFLFDDSIQSNDIKEAKLIITKKSGTDTLPSILFFLFKDIWSENSINFNWVYDNSHTNFTSIGTLNNISDDITFDLTQTVKNWISDPSSNYGIIIAYDGPVRTYLGNEYWDRENGNDNQKPRLVITLK